MTLIEVLIDIELIWLWFLFLFLLFFSFLFFFFLHYYYSQPGVEFVLYHYYSFHVIIVIHLILFNNLIHDTVMVDYSVAAVAAVYCVFVTAKLIWISTPFVPPTHTPLTNNNSNIIKYRYMCIIISNHNRKKNTPPSIWLLLPPTHSPPTLARNVSEMIIVVSLLHSSLKYSVQQLIFINFFWSFFLNHLIKF